MKRLITFFSICAVPVFLASNALATSYGYGSYDAECPKNTHINVKVYGYNVSSGGFGVVSTQRYKIQTGEIDATYGNYSSFISYLKSTVNVANQTYNGISIKKGLKPRGVVFYSLGTTNVPTEKIFKENGYITTNTACGISGFYKKFSGDIKTLAAALSFPVYENNTFPSLTKMVNGKTAQDLIINTYNETQINYIIAYAAACQENTNATCNLTIKPSGSAIYSNKCDGGCFMDGGSFGINDALCLDSVAVSLTPITVPSSTNPDVK